jgi:hypothetical protein
MPTITPGKSHSKVVLFSSGEAVVPNDFMLMQDLLTHRAWDLPHYPNIATHVQSMNDVATATAHETAAQNAVTFGSRPSKNAYSFPGCAMPRIIGSNGTGLLGGGIAIYAGAGGAPKVPDTTPDPASPATRFRFGWVPESDDASPVAFTHSPGHATLDRVDIVTVKIEDVDDAPGDLVTRQARHAVNGTISSSGFYKRRASRMTFTMTEGTPGDGFPLVMPSADDRLLYSVRRQSVASGGELVELCDWTMPFGRRRIEFTTPRHGYYDDGGGLVVGDPTTGGVSMISGGSIFLHPASFGNPSARLIGIRLHYKLPAGSNVLLVRFRAGRATSQFTLVETLNSAFTFDDAIRLRQLLLGNPFVSGDHAFTGGPGLYPKPYWMQGQTFRRFGFDSSETGGDPAGSPGLALLITASGPGVVYGCQWTTVE